MTAPASFWLGTSWKMTKTLGEAEAYADDLRAAVEAGSVPPELRLFVLPAATSLATVRDRLDGTGVALGAQNAHPGPDGAVTGEVSMSMVRDAGASLVEIGHAERRTLLGETDDMVADKVAAAVSTGLTPLVCVGETAAERTHGETSDVLASQVRAALSRLGGSRPSELLVAYEPHWAIGSEGRPARPADVAEGLAVVRRALDEDLAGTPTSVLYGGSVHAGNAADLMTGLDVDGLFVGRAAWTAPGLLDLAHRCADALRQRRRRQPTPDLVSAIVRKDPR
ncbi:triose-phosphate isomerase [Nocardioides sp.]|uniref:triose-phosphate isomerase n=1 Tax=Nocardioides sp. TaxID=35761 RepID=UPI00198DE34C|nr:triose-phosphate isomerase [Nocardioides sp.]MBC7275819.1 triose-phosphate isomerase [Nocardioides sp.]